MAATPPPISAPAGSTSCARAPLRLTQANAAAVAPVATSRDSTVPPTA